jgi:uncharacterized protein YaaN involved in tellurite resistance
MRTRKKVEDIERKRGNAQASLDTVVESLATLQDRLKRANDSVGAGAQPPCSLA